MDSSVSFQDISWSSIPGGLLYTHPNTVMKVSPEIKKSTKGIPKETLGYIRHVLQCEKCSRTFANNTALQRHIYSKHEDPNTKRLSCHLCPKKFNSQASLNRHIKIHQGYYAHHCKYCQKGFVTRDHLQGHISSKHTGERTFECNQCDRNFLYKSHLSAHQKKDHAGTC